MWPWGHLAVGYLVYSMIRRVKTTQPPSDAAVLAVAVGSQFPDVIDKPLAWWFNVLAAGRSLAHSLITAVLLLVVTYYVCRRNGRCSLWFAFGVGYLSHLFADVLQPVVTGEYGDVAFLLWPLLPLPPEHPTTLTRLNVSPFLMLEFLLLLVSVFVWLYDGAPGVDALSPSSD